MIKFLKMYNIWIVWATWAVWIEMINCLYNLKIPVKELRLYGKIKPKEEHLQNQNH